MSNDNTTAEEHAYDMDNLRHMLGIKSGTKKRDWGYRNHYCEPDAGPAYDSMRRLEAQGLVTSWRPSFWHATESGCKLVGLNEKQIKRALYDE